MSTYKLLNAQRSIATGAAITHDETKRSYQATVVGEGAVSATVVIEGGNDGIGYITLGTITLSGTTLATDGFLGDSSWTQLRAKLTAISGTNAAVTATIGA